jgi:hypothetical protein
MSYRTIARGIAAAVLLSAGCSTGPRGSSPALGDAGSLERTGSVGAQVTLAGGEHLGSVRYTLTGGTNPYSGTVDVSSASTVSFVIGGVASGSGYVLALTGTTDDGTVTCTGSSGPFSVADRTTTAVNVDLVCATTAEAGGVVLNGPTSNCPVWNTIVANPSQTLIGCGPVTLNAAAQGPDPGALTFAWTVTTGTGTVTNNVSVVQGNGATDTASFACPPGGGEVDTITLVVNDGPLPQGGSCPASFTTGTIQIVCGAAPCISCSGSPIGSGVPASPPTKTGACPTGQINTGTLKDQGGVFCCSPSPCAGVGTGVVASPNSATGTCPAATNNAGLRDASGNYCCSGGDIPPCTAAGQTGCVQCQGNANGICTATEAAFVAYDVAKGVATQAGPDPTAGCYTCLLNGSCLDDTVFGDANRECDDFGAATFAGSLSATLCQNVVSCVLSTDCDRVDARVCYCGTSPINTTCQGDPAPGPINGACATQIATGLGWPLTDGTDIYKSSTDDTKPTGRAFDIFQCAHANGCAACF